MRRRSVALGLTMVLVAVPAFPCGGPGADIVDRPLVPTSTYLTTTLYDDFEGGLRQDLQFLQPFRATMPDSIARLYAFVYESDGVPSLPDDTLRSRVEREALGPALRALERGAYNEAVVAARQAVDQILDVPAGLAAAYGDALRTAVEIVEVAPRFDPADRDIASRYFAGDSVTRQAIAMTGQLPAWLRAAFAVRQLPRSAMRGYAEQHPQSPRLPSLRFVALQQAMRTGIPDGWAGSAKDSVPPARWSELEQLHNDWLREFARHPMADYVKLSRMRLFYFAGEKTRAWEELLSLYPRHRERVLGEMRYLVRQGVMPPSLDDRRIDWPLRAALLPDVNITPDVWTTYWRASVSAGSQPWAVAMQERLLWRAIELSQSGKSLPVGFPTEARRPSELWAKLRLIALLQAGDIDRAFVQADSAADSVSDVAAIRVRLRLIRRDWGSALRVSPDSDAATAYLVRVLAPASVVDSLAAAPQSRLSRDARLTIAGRRAFAGDWRGASASAKAADPTRQRLWDRTVSLAGDPSSAGRLAFARWMRDQHGRLFFGANTQWVRGLGWRRNALAPDTSGRAESQPRLDPRLPWTAEAERAKIALHLKSTTELYYALHAYAEWLNGATATTPGVAAVVREADQVYNRLVNWDDYNSRVWADLLTASPEARSLRRAGALVRRQR